MGSGYVRGIHSVSSRMRSDIHLELSMPVMES